MVFYFVNTVILIHVCSYFWQEAFTKDKLDILSNLLLVLKAYCEYFILFLFVYFIEIYYILLILLLFHDVLVKFIFYTGEFLEIFQVLIRFRKIEFIQDLY